MLPAAFPPTAVTVVIFLSSFPTAAAARRRCPLPWSPLPSSVTSVPLFPLLLSSLFQPLPSSLAATAAPLCSVAPCFLCRCSYRNLLRDCYPRFLLQKTVAAAASLASHDHYLLPSSPRPPVTVSSSPRPVLIFFPLPQSHPPQPPSSCCFTRILKHPAYGECWSNMYVTKSRAFEKSVPHIVCASSMSYEYPTHVEENPTSVSV
ncbi:hypothetical protein GW17_00058239 [Ensete ventricosum]|nr:hypothetical protein GW17_00058239 [Ensete ventricosum]